MEVKKLKMESGKLKIENLRGQKEAQSK